MIFPLCCKVSGLVLMALEDIRIKDLEFLNSPSGLYFFFFTWVAQETMYPEVRTNSKFKCALIIVSWLPISCHRALMTAGLSTCLRLMAQEECLDPFVSIFAAAVHQNQSWCSQAIAGLEHIATVPPLSRKLVHLVVCFPMTNKISSTFSLQRWELRETKNESGRKEFPMKREWCYKLPPV